MATSESRGRRRAASVASPSARDRFFTDIAVAPPAERFERYTRLAADVLNVEACLVGLIDSNRGWARWGSGPHELAQLDLDALFDAVQSTGVSQIPDLEARSRFASHGVVINPPHYRLFAGIKLHGPRSRPVGVLIILGREPAELTASARRRLTDIAAMLEGELALTHELSETRRELERTHLLDSVTQLPGPTLLYDQVDAAIRDLDQDALLVAVHLEVANLDSINRAYGPAVGDELLRLLAHRAREATEDSPIVGRLPGARLVVVLRADFADVSASVHRVVEAMAQPTDIATDTVSPVLTAGVAAAPQDAGDGAALIECARRALRDTDDGELGPGVRFYDTGTRNHPAQQARIPFRLHEAVERRAFGLAFQPIRELADHRLVGIEALVRWDDEALGKVVPQRFIPHVEEDPALSRSVTQLILEGACEQAVALGSDGPDLSVNIPALEFSQPDFVPFVLSAVDSMGMPRNRVILELTEHSLLSDPRGVAATIKELGERGIRVALDDFGAGYSSLNYLRHLPLDSLKLDRSLVAELDVDLAAAEVASGLVSIGHSLGLLVVAEGIETPGELDLVRALGCDRGQGYLIGPPSNAAEAAAWYVHSSPRQGK